MAATSILRSSRLARIACAATACAALALPAAALADDTAPPVQPGPPTSLPGAGDLPTPTAPAVSCLVPSLRGLTVTAAAAKLGRSGCQVGRITRRAVAGARPGVVAAQTPKPGAAVAGGSPVGLVVAARA